MGSPELAQGPRFATHAARLANADALEAIIGEWARQQDRYEAMAALQAAGVPAAAVQDARDLTTRDAALARRGFFGEAEASSGTAGHGLDRFPARFGGERPDRYSAAASLGADTFEVLAEVGGLDSDAIAELAAEGVLA
jgi:crotonobetainyl-CoA:carnitine CoA-transferase CaiB-like acyl-CoA transferase